MEYIAALDLGTSKMLAMAASKDNRQKILATEQIESGDSIRRGLIYKTPEVSSKIAELIRRLNHTLKRDNLPDLKQVYVSIGGQGLHTKPYLIEKNIDRNIVDDKLLDQLHDECRADWNGSFELAEIVSPEYYLDGHSESQPQGVRCEKLEARFQLVVGHFSEFKTEVKKALEKESVELIDTFVAPLATAEFALTESEKESGCALVELGAGITYLSIYKSGLLRHLVTIPIGGDVITKDICSLDKTEMEAEEWKISEGCAFLDDESDELNNAIEARANEIVANILHQIETSGCGQTLNAGFILTGGASCLNGLDKLLEQQSKKPVRRVEDNPEQSCVRGMLLLGNENCGRESIQASGGNDDTIERDMFGHPIFRGRKSRKPPKEHRKDGVIIDIFKKGATILFNEETNLPNKS